MTTLLVLASGSTIALAEPADAHEAIHCGHRDYSNGGWYSDYVGHQTIGGVHYNFHAHYLNGVYQHTMASPCAS